MNLLTLRQDIEFFFMEDIGAGDITTNAIFSYDAEGSIQLTTKETGIFCGASVIQTAFNLVDPDAKINLFVQDGIPVNKGEKIAVITGKITALLTAERVVLNLVQRMCGVATLTKQAVETLNSPHTKVTDTRKTTPGLRMLEKYAVRCGGGSNHRFGLYDAIMIKDNHIAFAGSIKKAVYLARQHGGHMVKIEVETETRDQVFEAVEAGADVIMLDNLSATDAETFSALIPSHIVTEASGNIRLEDLPSYTATQIDYLSLGFLTHGYHALDISAKVTTI